MTQVGTFAAAPTSVESIFQQAFSHLNPLFCLSFGSRRFSLQGNGKANNSFQHRVDTGHFFCIFNQNNNTANRALAQIPPGSKQIRFSFDRKRNTLWEGREGRGDVEREMRVARKREGRYREKGIERERGKGGKEREG